MSLIAATLWSVFEYLASRERVLLGEFLYVKEQDRAHSVDISRLVMKFHPEDFKPAVEEARRVLKAMPLAEVPHALRKTRSSSSRKMTPLEARDLFRQLENDEEFRRVTLESWGNPSPAAADRRAAASVLFLERTENWERKARRYLTEVALEEALTRIERLQERESLLRADLKSVKAQTARVRQESDERVKRRTGELQRDLARARERISELERKLSEKGRDTDYWEREANAAWDDLDEADRRYHDLRERYSSKTRSAAASAEISNHRDMGFSRDPLKVARTLDQMVSFWEVGSDLESPDAEPAAPLALPPGFDPKSGDAMRWVFFEAPRLNLIVDGWNVAHYWHYHRNISGKPDAQTKEFITNKLEQLVRYSVGRHLVSFYLDSRFEIGLDPEWASRFKSRRLTGYYVPDADDAIVREVAARTGEPVVVVTSDNGLAERCGEYGAVRMYSEALAQWMADSPV